VAQALADYGARPWQIELTAGPIAQALGQAGNQAPDAADAEASDT
jgi:ribonuclease D